jgi:hypothetical protein
MNSKLKNQARAVVHFHNSHAEDLDHYKQIKMPSPKTILKTNYFKVEPKTATNLNITQP